jgi:hypothetical protein
VLAHLSVVPVAHTWAAAALRAAHRRAAVALLLVAAPMMQAGAAVPHTLRMMGPKLARGWIGQAPPFRQVSGGLSGAIAPETAARLLLVLVAALVAEPAREAARL